MGMPTALSAQMEETTLRGADEGDGPHERLILRGATIIDGTGSPPVGPVDIVIEGDRITEIQSVGFPGVPINEDRRPSGATREMDMTGMYIMPGFIDMHAHTGGSGKAPQPEYTYKLWMGHGITTSRGVGHGPMMWALQEKALAERNEIVAPRMFTYARPGEGWDQGPVDSPEKAREWVRWAAAVDVEGARIDGLKLGALDPDIMEAVIDEAHQHGLGTVAHLGQTGVARMTALDAAEAGLDMMTHYYGLMESMLTDFSIQDWPLDYNYQDEQHRFGNVARLWSQSAEPGSEEWNALIDRFLELDFGLDPTMTIYEASRDVDRFRDANYHDEYTLPSQWDFYTPSRRAHGSYWFYWTSRGRVPLEEVLPEVDALPERLQERRWPGDHGLRLGLHLQALRLRLHPRVRAPAGGRIPPHRGDPLRHPLRGRGSSTSPRARDIEFGILRPGLKADLVVVDENPLENLKVLYGNGAVRLNDETGEVERVGGIKYTIKDGIVYDAQQLLADVREMVRQAKEERAVSEQGS